jgi:hypothetical protein
MKKLYIIASIVASIALSACGPEQVSNDTLETGRLQAKANGEWLAQTYRAENPQYANYAYSVATDSTMSNTCPQGDGWVSAKLINKENPSQKVSLKCSTISSAVGCMPDSEFQTKSYAGDDGHCQNTTKVPYPIPKLTK